MDIKEYTDPAAFADTCLPFLLEHEAENHLMIGIVQHLVTGGEGWSDVPPEFYSLHEDGRLVGVSLRTPPHNLLLSVPFDKAVIAEFARYLFEREKKLPGVLSENETAACMRDCWCNLCGCSWKTKFSLRIYKLEKVAFPQEVEGAFRLATMDDMELLLKWHAAFSDDVGGGECRRSRIENSTKEGLYGFWCNPEPVCMVGASGQTPNGIRIAPVYTPLEFRNHGYASALTAVMSDRLLKSGRDFCFLFTDLANPTSNSIYQKIGYCPVCDFTDFRFVDVSD